MTDPDTRFSSLAIRLRDAAEADVPTLFEQQRDPDAIRMAAFVREDFGDREAFSAKWRKILADPDVVKRVVLVRANGPEPAGAAHPRGVDASAVDRGESLVGSMLAFRFPGESIREVGFWIAREWWGRGVATAALREFLRGLPERPLSAHCAADNVGSRRVLEKCGFRLTAVSRAHAHARACEIDECEFMLDA